MLRRALLLAAFAAAAAVPLGAGATGTASSGYRARVDNPWFPLVPGTTYVYEGVKDGKRSREILHVTHRTRTIGGAPCVVVEDRLFVAGHLGERTTDWYTQDRAGNVWYFGEDTAELDAHGHVTSTEGTWRAGLDGAKPGIFMPARPRSGQSGVQEHYTGHAEDHFRVIGFLGTNGLLIEEWNPLEPGVLDHKLYVRGTGTVLERTVKGGDELNELVSMRRA